MHRCKSFDAYICLKGGSFSQNCRPGIRLLCPEIDVIGPGLREMVKDGTDGRIHINKDYLPKRRDTGDYALCIFCSFKFVQVLTESKQSIITDMTSGACTKLFRIENIASSFIARERPHACLL